MIEGLNALAQVPGLSMMRTAVRPGVAFHRLARIALSLGLVLGLATQAIGQAPTEDDAAEEEPDSEARAMFEAGRSAFSDGRYATALQRWEVAFGLSGRPALRYNLGLAHERLGNTSEAITNFESYLKWEPDGERSDEVRSKLESLRASLRAPSPAQTARAAAPASNADAQPTDNVASEQTQTVDPTPAAPPDAETTPATVDPSDERTPWYGQWYVWAAVAVVLAGTATAVVLTADDEPGRREPGSGVTVQTLQWSGN